LNINQTICTSTSSCGGPNSTSGSCDYDGCDFNPYRLGNKAFFGPGLTVDTTKAFTVVTQFIGSPLTDINRFYIQDGVTIQNPASQIVGVKGNSITPAFCTEELAAFKEVNSFGDFGGFAGISAAFTKGMVLAFAVEGNYFGNETQWLDGTYPFGMPATVEGAVRGPCAVNTASTDPVGNNAGVTFSNIRIGAINSTT
jgi:cellulose 1,4-beta-cellobiosidase